MARTHHTGELWADGLVHAIGIAASICATIFLILHAQTIPDDRVLLAVCIYGAVITASFLISGIYNLWPWTPLQEGLRRADHATIFLKIAGTYTPLVVLLGSVFGYIVLGIVWAIAVCAAIAKLAVAHWPKRLSLAIYLGLSWIAVVLIYPMMQTFDTASLILILVGGLIYTLGTVIYSLRAMRYQYATWHLFVLIASACFFAAIWMAI